jgi:hypothetical protein
MAKILRNIDVELTPEGIQFAVDEVNDFIEQLQMSLSELAEALTRAGQEAVKIQIASLDAVYTAELENSIQGYYDADLHEGVIFTNVFHALFVEYGTGVVGAGTYPTTTADGWQYDINNHGEEGWVYRNDRDGRFYWTNGYPARPFMFNAFEWLKEAAPELASRLWTQM